MFNLLRASGPVAQRLEQGTHNPLVPGSNPGGPNFIFNFRFVIVERTPAQMLLVSHPFGAEWNGEVVPICQ